MLVQRAAIAGATGIAAGGGENAGGDQQKKLDVVSNDLLKGFLARSGVVRVLASEEVGRCWCVLYDGNAYHTQQQYTFGVIRPHPYNNISRRWIRVLLYEEEVEPAR